MIKRLKKFARNHLINIPGWKTDRKIVVIESDDWGMIRMASKEAYDWFLKNGYKVDQCPYNRNDAIESNRDLELLFEVLSSVKDKANNPAVFTINNVVANPDFDKIKDSGFKEYYYEPFTKTLKRYPGRDNVIRLYEQGREHNVFFPQFHGREHLNVNRWMAGLNAENKTLLDAFSHNMFTVHESGKLNCIRDHLDAFGLGYNKKWVTQKEIIESGLNLFEDIWGFRSSSFIAPCYTWSKEIEKNLAANGVKYLQGSHVQRVPLQSDEPAIKGKYHYTGQANKMGQRYLVRNVQFEPTEYTKNDPVDKALKEIKIAFKYNRPAIISSHRVNYVGSIRPENRSKNLRLLDELLNKVVKHFPDVEFMSTNQLGDLIIEDN